MRRETTLKPLLQADHGGIAVLYVDPTWPSCSETGCPSHRGNVSVLVRTSRSAADQCASDLIRVERADLRIVPEDLAARVDARRADRAERYLRGHRGQLLGHPALGKYLLSGLLRCPCGANFEAQKSPHGMRRGEGYVCAAHRRKGAAICANRLALPIAETDERVLTVIEHVVLTPAFVERVLDTVFVPDDADRPTLEAERDELERQIANLTAAVKAGGDIPALVSELKATNARLADVRWLLEPCERGDRAQLRAALEQRVDDWKHILRAHPSQARQVLSHVLNGPIEIRLSDGAELQALLDAGIDLNGQAGKEGITPEDCRLSEEAFREVAEGMRQMAGMLVWTAQTKPAGLLAGMPLVQRLASPTGFEPVFWP